MCYYLLCRHGYTSNNFIALGMFCKSTLLLVITAASLVARRKDIHEKGFHAGWSAMTFPTTSSAMAAGMYATDFDVRVKVYANCVAGGTALIVAAVGAGMAWRGGWRGWEKAKGREEVGGEGREERESI